MAVRSQKGLDLRDEIMSSKKNEDEEGSSRRSLWIEAAKCLLISKKSRVRCPECDEGFLERIDLPGSSKKQPKFELRCKECGASMELEL